MGVNSLHKTVTRQRRDCDLNPVPSMPEFSTLTTRLLSHPRIGMYCILMSCYFMSGNFSPPHVSTRPIDGTVGIMFSGCPSVRAACVHRDGGISGGRLLVFSRRRFVMRFELAARCSGDN